MASQTSQPHFVLIPLMAQGHMIPMIDLARLFAERGVIVSLVTTPNNASKFDKIVHRAKESGLPLRLVQIEFSCQEVGHPIGYENLEKILQEPLEKHLEKQNPPPTCIISDKSLFWTSKTAQKFNIPRLVFHGMGCFSLLSLHNIKYYNAHQSVTSDSEPFVIPGLPQRIEITKGRGLLIRGWAPQVFILSHPAVGGFLTHCGWNSIIESMCSGLPMITWPLFAEQFFNEKLVVEVLRIGIRVGVDIRWGDEERVGVLVKKDEVEKTIVMLMDEGEEGEKKRRQSSQEAEQPTHNSSHVIFAFMFPVVLSLLGVEYQGKGNTPFDVHPITMSFGIACFLAYCLAYGSELNCFVGWLSPTHAPQLRRSMVVLGSLSLASFVSVLFPGSVQSILLGIYVLLLMGFLLHAQVKIFWKWIKQRIVARLFRLWESNVTDRDGAKTWI